ncbi:AsnC family transcriptional regulator [Fictibacillus macauensis ZFHKF-1]|uniref:AsnC family transcriptional regulator n=1 Tax=Fictibacillus macauensis ZFHKF-1 TaxID=1196324 RepID=I8AKP3_9BACL|nr:AsnC family transcriptional regulator [Fictibacillus macauensis ZFHKF-1]
MDAKQRELLQLIEKNGRLDISTISNLMNITQEETSQMLKKLEKENIILGYSAIINWAKDADEAAVTAMIDVKVTPKRGVGFDKVAERIYRFPEVKAVYLMSGVYDLSVSIEGKTMAEVAQFVSEKLSTIDSVISTTTHFVLKKYKHDGLVFSDQEEDKRMMVTP